MASTSSHFIMLCSLLFLSTSLAKTPPRPKSLVLPITKDPSTNQYNTHIKQRTPLTTVSLTVDLGGKHLWTNCETGYTSSTIRPGGCGTPQCRLAAAAKVCESCPRTPLGGPGCSSASTCWTFIDNTVIRVAAAGQLASDVLSINSTDGKSPGRVFSVPEFYFFCASNLIMGNLSEGVTGMGGLGWTKVSLPYQLASFFKFQKKFSLCLSPSTKRSKGFVLIGNGHYTLPPLLNVSTSLAYTPLIRNKVNIQAPVLPGEYSPEYFIGIKSIKVNEKQVPINTTLLSIRKEGFGGTSISTVVPYTALETSIYNAVIKAFVSGLPRAIQVAPVAPFGACFRSSSIGSTRVGPAVPPIDLVFEKVSWRIYGANSMVQVNKDVMCLGVVDGGEGTFITSIVIGGHQIQDNLLEFDVGKSRLGFSSSLLFRQTTCANFQYASN